MMLRIACGVIAFFTWTLTVMAESETNITVGVTLSAPDGSWTVEIEEAFQVENELWVIARLTRREGMFMQRISTISDSAAMSAPAGLSRRSFILGKTWRWQNTEDYEFPESETDLRSKLKDARRLYPVDDATAKPDRD